MNSKKHTRNSSQLVKSSKFGISGMTEGDGDLDPIPDHYEQQAAQLGRTSLDDVAKSQSQTVITAAPPTPQGDNQSHDDTERGLLANSSKRLMRQVKSESKIEEKRREEDEDKDEDEEEKKE